MQKFIAIGLLALLGCSLVEAARSPTRSPDTTWTECDEDGDCREYQQWDYRYDSSDDSDDSGSSKVSNSNSNINYNSNTNTNVNDNDNYNYYNEYYTNTESNTGKGQAPSRGSYNGGCGSEDYGHSHGHGHGGNIISDLIRLPAHLAGDTVDTVLGGGLLGGRGRGYSGGRIGFNGNARGEVEGRGRSSGLGFGNSARVGGSFTI